MKQPVVYWLVAFLVLVVGGFMLFDGARAIAVGDYVTPAGGPRAGQLGPWAHVVRTLGIDPRSTGMKLSFIAYGALYLLSSWLFVAGVTKARWSTLVLAACGLWYLPFGTLINAGVIAILIWAPQKSG